MKQLTQFCFAAITLLILGQGMALAQKHEGGSFDGQGVGISGVISLSGANTAYSYTNPRFLGGGFDGAALGASNVISLSGAASAYTYTNPRFLGGSFDGSSALATGVISLTGNPTAYSYLNPRFYGGNFDGSSRDTSAVISLIGTPSPYTYLNPRFYGGSFDGSVALASAIITLEGGSSAYTYTNPRYFGGSFSGFSSIRALGPVTLDVPNRERPIPKDFALLQNFPNPFNPTTTLRYQLPRSGFVQLEVFDVLGRKVATLISETKAAGYYTYTLSANQLALGSGVYFYRIQSGDFSEIRKMILLK
ncbi:MAG: T9SS type A sorting domain-containing protein [Chloroherpetonaceae bacterium]|nr:T9SS type A sorting domain-containing protein [Chloroherpetonaceae bacterium]